MCRNIKTLFNYDPPVTEDEVRAAATQFVRKISGFSKVSEANRRVYATAIEEITQSASTLLASLVTNAPPRNREAEAVKARTRAIQRFGGGT